MSQSKRLFILEKAIELFSKHGFEAVSIQDITDYCGISKGAFYLSFKSKDELVIALFEHLLTSVAMIFDRAVSSPLEPQMRLQKLFEELLQFMRMNRGLATFFVHEHSHIQNQNKNKNFIQLIAKYEEETRSTFGQVLDSIYGNTIAAHKQDLILCFNSLCHTYFEYVCLRGLDINVTTLAQSLVEKMNILATASYKFALPNESLLEVRNHCKLTSDDLHIFKTRILDDIKNRMTEETDPLIRQTLEKTELHLKENELDSLQLYAYSALLREYKGYEDLALRVRSYTKIIHPQ